ncbi:MAG TPA: DUF4293 family protein [Brumimicrobium sp.]|nr:DUF4293 family protein [Brumimicrobium sp.]
MIQRIQTLWLLAAIIILCIISFSGNFFIYVTDIAFYNFDANGITQKTLDNKEVMSITAYPIYFATLGMAVFAMFIIFSYKNLKRQYTYAKFLWGLYIFSLFAIVTWNYYIAGNQVDGKILRSNFGANFYLMVIGLPLVHLAMVNIGKDKNKIDSLNRLR